MYCPNCGKEQVDDAKFCRSCGAQLVQAQGAPPSAPADAPPVIQRDVQQGAPPVIQRDISPNIQAGMGYAPALEYAGFWRRFGAYIIDYILIGIVGWVIALILGFLLGAAGADEATSMGLAYSVIVVIYWLYYAVSESSSKQATPGKRALGIIVTDDNGGRISFGRATGRLFSKIVSGIIIYIGFFMIAWTKKKQGLHDMMAGTLVIMK